MGFEWDEKKREINLERHGIDFVRAQETWQGPVLEIPSRQTHHGEERFLGIGVTKNLCLTVVFTWRKKNRRIISARRANKLEREIYAKNIG